MQKIKKKHSILWMVEMNILLDGQTIADAMEQTKYWLFQ